MKLWYKNPAKQWNHALPVGNARLGAMIFGEVLNERIQLNEETIWAGRSRDVDNPQAFEKLEQVRRLLFEERTAEATAIAEAYLMGNPKDILPYEALGDLFIEFVHTEEIINYQRMLDLNTAIAEISYDHNNCKFRREIFSSSVNQVMVIRLTCDQPARISFTARLEREKDAICTAQEQDIFMIGQCDNGKGICFNAILRVIPEGGSVTTNSDNICVRDADAVTLYFVCNSNFRDESYDITCKKQLEQAVQLG
ncbi:MAG: glycoside hydrolase family 95 protein, partial [Vallitaleaceae bacterium]|nr:glycoside hydrolase family 95 protein [Vallitaleaceae bacterium]